MVDNRRLPLGAFGFDMGQNPPQPVMVVDEDNGRVGDLKPALREMVLDSAGNRALGVTEDSETCVVSYVGIDSTGAKTYTMPKERIGITQATIDTEDGSSLSPHEYIQYMVVRDIVAEAVSQDTASETLGLLKQSGIDEDVIEVVRIELTDLVEI